jgi:phosphoserine phosphatase
MRVARVERLAAEYFEKHHRDAIFPEMQQLIRSLESTGFPAWIVTGGPHEVVVAGARWVGGDKLADRVIGLRLKRDEQRGTLTHDFDGPVPWGEGKVSAIQHWIPERRRPAIAIGNSNEGDGPMLTYATDLRVAIHPDDALRRIADITRLPGGRGPFMRARRSARHRHHLVVRRARAKTTGRAASLSPR